MRFADMQQLWKNGGDVNCDTWSDDELWEGRGRLVRLHKPNQPPADAFVSLSRKRLASQELGLEYMEVEAHGDRAEITEEWCRREYKRLRNRRDRRRRREGRRHCRARRPQRFDDEPAIFLPREDAHFAVGWSDSEDDVEVGDNALTRAKVDEIEMLCH